MICASDISTFNILIVFFSVTTVDCGCDHCCCCCCCRCDVQVIWNRRVTDRLLRKPNHTRKQLLRNDMKYETKLFRWLMAESFDSIVTFALNWLLWLEFLTNIIYFVKHYSNLQDYLVRPCSSQTTTTKMTIFNRWTECLYNSRRWRKKKTTVSRAESVIMLRNAITFRRREKKYAFGFFRLGRLLWFSFLFVFVVLECVTWQLRATTWCVKPFVTVVTNDSKV